MLPFTENPPFVYTPTSFNGNVSDLANASRALFPGSINAIAVSGEVPTVMSYSLGVQRDIGWGTLLDVAYAGNQGRHLRQSVNLNAIAPGTTSPLPARIPAIPGSLCPRISFGHSPGSEISTTSPTMRPATIIHLQVQVHRRFAKGLEVSGVWTWSKTMSTSDNGAVSPYLNERARYYGWPVLIEHIS